MRRLRVELFVRDLTAATDFYTRILGFQKCKDTDDYVSVSHGSVVIGLGPMDKLPPTHPLCRQAHDERTGVGVELVCEVDDLEAFYNQVAQTGYPIFEPLQKRSWGATDFRMIDPDGYYIRITQAH